MPLRPPPTGFTFSPPLLSRSAHLGGDGSGPSTSQRRIIHTGDGSGPSTSPRRIIHTGDGSGPSSSQPHSESQHEEGNNAEDNIEPSFNHVRGDGAIYIRPDSTGTGFIDSHVAASAIYDAIRAHFVQHWPTWCDILIEVRDRMFSEFKRKVYWSPKNDQIIRCVFEFRGMRRFSDIFHNVRRKDTRPPWIGDHVWNCLQQHWQSEKFKKKQNQAKCARTSDKGGCLNTFGNVSHETHAARMERDTGKRPSRVDLFLFGHKKKNRETGLRDEWVDSRSESTYNAFQSLAAEERVIQSQNEATDDSTARTQNPPRSEDELFAQATGGVYKGRVYGMGNQTPRQRSIYSASSLACFSQAQYDEVCHKVSELTEEINTGRHKVAELTEEVNTGRHRVAELTEEVNIGRQQSQQREDQLLEMIQSLQERVQKMDKGTKKIKKHYRNKETDSSSDTDTSSD